MKRRLCANVNLSAQFSGTRFGDNPPDSLLLIARYTDTEGPHAIEPLLRDIFRMDDDMGATLRTEPAGQILEAEFPGSDERRDAIPQEVCLRVHWPACVRPLPY